MELRKRKTIEKNDEINACSFEKISKTDKPLENQEKSKDEYYQSQK